MVLWAKRLTSLAAAFALSGSAAVLSACMALCLQAMPAAATSPHQSEPASHAAHTPPLAVAAGHAHHQPPASQEPVASADARTSPESPGARLIATCDDCCPDGVAFVAGSGVERTAAHAFGAAPMVSSAGRFLVAPSAVGAVLHSPSVPPPLPAKGSLVLRI